MRDGFASVGSGGARLGGGSEEAEKEGERSDQQEQRAEAASGVVGGNA